MEKAEYLLSISVFTPYFYGSKTWHGQHAVPKSSMVCSLSSACSWFTLLRISMFSDRSSAMSIFLSKARTQMSGRSYLALHEYGIPPSLGISWSPE
jgi:hypothetical protein